MAQSAASAITAGCQMLSEGRADLDKFKRTTEKAVGDAKAIYREVTGLWGWFRGLFGGVDNRAPASVPSSTPAAAAAPSPAPKKIKRSEEPELSYEEFQARQVHDICENLKVYFEAIRQLKAHCKELEEASLTTDRVADSAIDRIEMEWQMVQLSNQVSHAMVYGTPEKLGLGDLYKKFLKMYDQILEEQEFDRMRKQKKERDETWRREHRREILIYKLTYAAGVVIMVLEMIGLYFTL